MTPPSLPPEIFDALPLAAQAYIRYLEAQLADLEARLTDLEARLNQNSTNSSKPPSSDPPSAKPAPPTTPSGKSKGGQHGHAKHSRPLLPPDDIIELKADTCRQCRTPLTGNDPKPLYHQVIEIPPIRPHVTEYRQHRLTCPQCQQVNCAGLPTDVRGGYGPRVQAVCALLSGAYRIGKRGIAQICQDLFGVPISPAAVCDLQDKTSNALAPIATEAQAHVVEKPANVDETSWSEGNNRHWLWTAVTRAVSVFVIRPSRARKVLTDLIPGTLGVLTTVRDKPGGRSQRADARLTAADARGGKRHKIAHKTVRASYWRAVSATVYVRDREHTLVAAVDESTGDRSSLHQVPPHRVDRQQGATTVRVRQHAGHSVSIAVPSRVTRVLSHPLG